MIANDSVRSRRVHAARARRRAGWALLLVAFGSLLASGCGLFRELGVGGDEPLWVERRYRDITTSAALQLLQTAVQERYPPRRLDLNEGTFESGWVYGAYESLTHQALRQRILAETERASDGTLTLRLRVQQETSPSAGRVSSRDVDDWELAEDSPDEAERLLARAHVLLRDVAKPVEATGATPAGG